MPGKYGSKAAGFTHDGIDPLNVVSPISMQLAKVYSMFNGPADFQIKFDHWVAELIQSRKLKPEIFITLQDFMPLSVRAAHENGALIWSDQILNSSSKTIKRIERHCADFGIKVQPHSELDNDWILSIASIVTVPSSFVEEGVIDRISHTAKLNRVPYGINFDLFKPNEKFIPDPNILHVVARANSVRKGGHLLFEVIERYSWELLKKSNRSKLKVTFIGGISAELKFLLDRTRNIENCEIVEGDISHLSLPDIFGRADFMVMPTLAEGMSLIIPEALACGLPVVSTRFSGVDYLVDNHNGMLSEDTVDSLFDAMTRMIVMLEDWRVIRSNSRKSVMESGWLNYSSRISKICKVN
ncbi:MAG: glycosyltransferase family 4 protein [Pedobacter sp.]|nr:glycosyltransferase family 4 protein [Pedobacter sp.]